MSDPLWEATKKTVPFPQKFMSDKTIKAAGLTLKDSGKREEMPTGSRRDSRAGKGRFDLLPARGLRALAVLFEAGAVKYGDRNWEKGQPLARYLDSGLRHAVSVLQGLTDEDHLRAAAWNFLCALDTRERIAEGLLPAELDDIPKPVEHPSRQSFSDLDIDPWQSLVQSSQSPEPGCYEVPDGGEETPRLLVIHADGGVTLAGVAKCQWAAYPGPTHFTSWEHFISSYGPGSIRHARP